VTFIYNLLPSDIWWSSKLVSTSAASICNVFPGTQHRDNEHNILCKLLELVSAWRQVTGSRKGSVRQTKVITCYVQYIKIIIYKIIISAAALCRCENWSLTLRNEHKLCLRTGCWVEYLDLRGTKWREVIKNWIMRSLIMCSLHHILLGWSNKGDRQGMQHARERWEKHT
jgi:hypothetical protein